MRKFVLKQPGSKGTTFQVLNTAQVDDMYGCVMSIPEGTSGHSVDLVSETSVESSQTPIWVYTWFNRLVRYFITLIFSYQW